MKKSKNLYLALILIAVIAVIVIFALCRQPSLDDGGGSRTITKAVTVLKSEGGHAAEEAVKNGEAAYSYEMQETNSEEADVALEFEVRIDRKIYSGTANGSVFANTFSSGEKLWEGSLDGTLRVGDAAYEILVGFAKQDQAQEMQGSVTVLSASDDTGTKELPFMGFTFGESVITQDMLEEMMS